MAALQTVPSSIYEAAELDDTPKIRTFFKITLPMISPTILFTSVVASIASFKIFDSVNVMTQGGPGHDTETFGTLIMNEMSQGRFAQSVAVNFVFTILLVIIAIAYQKFSARWEDID